MSVPAIQSKNIPNISDPVPSKLPLSGCIDSAKQNLNTLVETINEKAVEVLNVIVALFSKVQATVSKAKEKISTSWPILKNTFHSKITMLFEGMKSYSRKGIAKLASRHKFDDCKADSVFCKLPKAQ